MRNSILLREDYEEPNCLLCSPNTATVIPQNRVLEKLDGYLSRNDYTSAERHLKYWLNEAELCFDKRGKLTVVNELVGLYRKLGKKEESLSFSEVALELVNTGGWSETVTMGTTFINVATAYKAFGKVKEAIPLFEKAEKIYKERLKDDDERLGGLYNNMALAFLDIGEYRKAEDLFGKALSVMLRVPGGEPEIAVTYCNLANLVEDEFGLIDGEEKINKYLEKAMAFLNTEELQKDGNYAFVCEKCAPTFGYYGYFIYENELKERARRIYERP